MDRRPTRRGLLAVAGTVAGAVVLDAVAGCSAGAPGAAVTSRSDTPSASSASTLSSPAPSFSAPSRPSREEIVRRYGSVTPQHWGLEVPGMLLRLPTTAPVIALTFDACGGPTPTSAGCGVDRDLIALLRRYQVKATLFLNRRWIAANPGIAADLVHDPLFEIGNHGSRHLPLSVNGRSAYGAIGTRSVAEVYDEVALNQDNLTSLLGRPPRHFRSGTAHADEVAVRIAADLGLTFANFSVNGDAGTTFTAHQIVTTLATATGGDIVISHLNRPEHQTAEGYAVALPRLLERGLRGVHLSEHLG
jgi:peptidoglycan/xylan/chitin deacetylase (PgdA/CDA1 family)